MVLHEVCSKKCQNMRFVFVPHCVPQASIYIFTYYSINVKVSMIHFTIFKFKPHQDYFLFLQSRSLQSVPKLLINNNNKGNQDKMLEQSTNMSETFDTRTQQQDQPHVVFDESINKSQACKYKWDQRLSLQTKEQVQPKMIDKKNQSSQTEVQGITIVAQPNIEQEKNAIKNQKCQKSLSKQRNIDAQATTDNDQKVQQQEQQEFIFSQTEYMPLPMQQKDSSQCSDERSQQSSSKSQSSLLSNGQKSIEQSEVLIQSIDEKSDERNIIKYLGQVKEEDNDGGNVKADLRQVGLQNKQYQSQAIGQNANKYSEQISLNQLRKQFGQKVQVLENKYIDLEQKYNDLNSKYKTLTSTLEQINKFHSSIKQSQIVFHFDQKTIEMSDLNPEKQHRDEKTSMKEENRIKLKQHQKLKFEAEMERQGYNKLPLEDPAQLDERARENEKLKKYDNINQIKLNFGQRMDPNASGQTQATII